MNLFYHSFGTGSPLVIVHGLFGISDNWVTIGKQLSGEFRVIIPDLRNHGRSPWSPVFNFSSMEEDILELIEEETSGPVLLMGHSLGGRITINIALHHPEMIRRLVVVDISLRKYPPQSIHLQLIHAMQQLDLSSIRTRSEAGRKLGELIPSKRLRQFLLKNLYWQEKGVLGWRLNLPVINESLPAIFEDGDVPGVFPGPALFVRGGKSDYITDADLPAIQQRFPGSIVRTIKGASHWVHADHPGEFLRVVNDFLIST